MGWKTRGGRSYFYQSERVGGRVVSSYVGTGDFADLMAGLQGADRLRRGIEAAERREERERAERFTGMVVKACSTLAAVADAIVESSGYHRHHRGSWRRRRTMIANALPAKVEASSGADPSLARRYLFGEEAAVNEVRGLFAKSEKGDRAAASRLGELMRAEPVIAEISIPDISRTVEDQMIRRTYGEEALGAAEAVRVRLSALRNELAGPKPSAVERLLAERVALCWLDCHHLEFRDVAAGNRTIAQADCTGRQRDRAHRRYLAALKALAAVRKLPIVAIQVNVGGDEPPEARG